MAAVQGRRARDTCDRVRQDAVQWHVQEFAIVVPMRVELHFLTALSSFETSRFPKSVEIVRGYVQKPKKQNYSTMSAQGGAGMKLEWERDSTAGWIMRVKGVLPRGPADVAGIAAGDEILGVSSQAVLGKTLEQVTERSCTLHTNRKTHARARAHTHTHTQTGGRPARGGAGHDCGAGGVNKGWATEKSGGDAPGAGETAGA